MGPLLRAHGVPGPSNGDVTELSASPFAASAQQASSTGCLGTCRLRKEPSAKSC